MFPAALLKCKSVMRMLKDNPESFKQCHRFIFSPFNYSFSFFSLTLQSTFLALCLLDPVLFCIFDIP